MKPSAYRIALVHGTFARGASWTQEGSLLRSTLAGKLDLPVAFSVFEWTGNNDHGSRLAAAQELQSFMRGLIRDNPLDLHFVIAHSHGGNIILHALKDNQIRENISGVITMGTPFISCESREVKSALGLLKYAIPVVSLFAMCLIIGLPLVPLLTYLGNRYGIWGFWLGFGVPVFVGFAMYQWLLDRFRDFVRYDSLAWAATHQERLAQLLNVEGFTRPPFFCAVVNRDEAGRWLSSLETISNGPGSLFFAILQLWRKTRWWLLGLFVVALALSVIGYSSDEPGEVLMGVAIGIMVASVILQLSMLLFPKMVRAHKFGFGGETFFDNWLSNIVIHESPVGILANVRRFEAEARLTSGLRHSMFYENGTCLNEMASWMRTNAVRRDY
jgi:hypothetical protein